MDKPKICVSCVPALFSTNLQQCFLKDFRICSVVQMTGALVSSAKEMGRISVLLSVFTFYPRFGSYCEYRCFSNCVSEPWHTEPLGDFIYKSRINILLTGFFWSFSMLSVLNVSKRDLNASANWHCKLKINKDHSKLVLVLWWMKTSLEHLGWFALAVSDLPWPWVICFCREWFAFVVTWAICFGRKRICYMLLPRAICSCCERFALAVSDLLLPWVIYFCCEWFAFDVTWAIYFCREWICVYRVRFAFCREWDVLWGRECFAFVSDSCGPPYIAASRKTNR